MRRILSLDKRNVLLVSILVGMVGVCFVSASDQAGVSGAVTQPNLPSATAPMEPRVFPHPGRIRYDSQCLIIDGKDTMIFSGAFHYFRCPKELWPERFQKIKD